MTPPTLGTPSSSATVAAAAVVAGALVNGQLFREPTTSERVYFAESWTRVIAASGDIKQALRRFYCLLVAEVVTLTIRRDTSRSRWRTGDARDGGDAAGDQAVDAAMKEGVFMLIDSLTKHELQNLYVSLPTPAAVSLKTLFQRYTREHKFSGKV